MQKATEAAERSTYRATYIKIQTISYFNNCWRHQGCHFIAQHKQEISEKYYTSQLFIIDNKRIYNFYLSFLFLLQNIFKQFMNIKYTKKSNAKSFSL